MRANSFNTFPFRCGAEENETLLNETSLVAEDLIGEKSIMQMETVRGLVNAAWCFLCECPYIAVHIRWSNDGGMSVGGIQ